MHAAIFFRFLNHVEKIPPVTRSPWSVIVDVLLLRKDFVHLLSLCETFVSGGVFTLFHCSIPRATLFGQNFRFVLGLFCPVERGVLALSTMSRPVSLSVSTRIHIVRIRVGFTLVKRWVH